MVGDQIGFDEGGVFQSLSDPIYTKTVVKYTYKGDKVTTETTVVTNITGAHVLAAVMGPALIALFVATKDLDPDVKMAILAASPFGFVGMAAAWGLSTALTGDEENDSEIGGKGKPRTFSEWIDYLTGGGIW